jgi:hypothetical protein
MIWRLNRSVHDASAFAHTADAAVGRARWTDQVTLVLVVESRTSLGAAQSDILAKSLGPRT